MASCVRGVFFWRVTGASEKFQISHIQNIWDKVTVTFSNHQHFPCILGHSVNPLALPYLKFPFLKIMIVAGGVDADQALSSTELFDYNRPGATWISATNLPGDPFCIKNFIAIAALLVCKPFPFQCRIQIWCFFVTNSFLLNSYW